MSIFNIHNPSEKSPDVDDNIRDDFKCQVHFPLFFPRNIIPHQDRSMIIVDLDALKTPMIKNVQKDKPNHPVQGNADPSRINQAAQNTEHA